MRDIENLIKNLRKTALEAEQEKAEANAIFSSIGEGIIVTNEQGKISRINQTALKILGCKEKELLGKWFPKAVPADDEMGKSIPPLKRPITQAILSGKPVYAKLFFQKKNAKKVPVAVTVSPILLANKPVGAVEIFRDITKELEVDRMKSEFISIASHQLRTPLTAIKLDSEMLKDGYFGNLKSEQKKHVEMILFSIARMEELISTLLNITRIEAGKIAVTPKLINLDKLIRGIIKELKGEASDKEIKVTLNCASNLPKINTDALLVKETCANLLSNAIKYTPSKGKISISVYVKDKDVITSFRDSGYGIPQAEQTRIFSKFYRGSNITHREAIGTGLGLYMIKGVVDSLGGKIWFDSEEDKGTTFYFSLPLQGTAQRAGITTIEPTVV